MVTTRCLCMESTTHARRIFPVNYELYDYQYTAVEFIIRRERRRQKADQGWYGGALLVMRMGLGKTLCGLCAVSFSLARQRIFKQQTLYITTASLLCPTNEQCIKFFGVDITSFILNYNISRNHVSYEYMANINRRCRLADVVFISYETLRSIHCSSNPYTRYLFDRVWYRVIMDESHNLMTSDTLLYQSVVDLNTERRIAMTGTVMQSSLADVANQMYCTNPFGSRRKPSMDNTDFCYTLRYYTHFVDFDIIDAPLCIEHRETKCTPSLVCVLSEILKLYSSVVVFANSTRTLKAVAVCMKQYNVMTLDSGVGISRRGKIIDRCRRSCRLQNTILFASAPVAAQGIDLSFMRSIVFIDTCHYQGQIIRQCVYRVKRPGFKHINLHVVCAVKHRRDYEFIRSNLM